MGKRFEANLVLVDAQGRSLEVPGARARLGEMANDEFEEDERVVAAARARLE